MSHETSKAYRRLMGDHPPGTVQLIEDPIWRFVSRSVPHPWLDIGAGEDCLPGAIPFDKHHGDAETLTTVSGIPFRSLAPSGKFGLVWSSHCLEHMRDPYPSLETWWDAVEPGGVLWLHVPDFALYEHAYWPSRMNRDHRFAFSCYGEENFPDHVILDHVWRDLPRAKLLRLGVQCRGYDLSRILDPIDQTLGEAEASCELVLRKLK